MTGLWIARMVEEQFHRDADDRPLRERRTPAEHLRPDDIAHRTCPYPGTRFQHARPMNASALRQTSAHWSDLIDALSLLRGLHAAQRGDAPLDVMDLWRVSQLGSALPWFYILHDGERAPGYAAALSKATQGVGIWAQRLLVEMIAGAPPFTDFTAQGLWASAEASGTLVGDAEVCAGSEPMLRRFFEAMLHGEPSLDSAPMQRLAAARDDVLRFGAHYANFKLLLWIHALARQFVYADLVAALGPDHAATAELRALLDDNRGEPPDFLMVRPPDPAAVPRPLRAAWLAGLARQVVSFAPDRSDLALRAHAAAIALASGTDELPAADLPAALALPLATFARLDAILGDLTATVEAGFRGAAFDGPIDAATRDRLLLRPPRALLCSLAPALAALCPR